MPRRSPALLSLVGLAASLTLVSCSSGTTLMSTTTTSPSPSPAQLQGYRNTPEAGMGLMLTKDSVAALTPNLDVIKSALGVTEIVQLPIEVLAGVGNPKSSLKYTVKPATCAPVHEKGLRKEVVNSALLRWDSTSTHVVGGKDSKTKLPDASLSASITHYANTTKANEAFDLVAKNLKDCQKYETLVTYKGRDLPIEYILPFAQVDNQQNFIEWADIRENLEYRESVNVQALVLVGNMLVLTDGYKQGSFTSQNIEAFNQFTQDFVLKIAGVAGNSRIALLTLSELSPNAPFPLEEGKREIPTNGLVYSVTGSADSASMTYETSSGTAQTTASLPWSQTISGIVPGGFVYVSAQEKSGRSGSTVTCTITFNGKVLSSVTSSGAFSIAQCDGSLPSLRFP